MFIGRGVSQDRADLGAGIGRRVGRSRLLAVVLAVAVQLITLGCGGSAPQDGGFQFTGATSAGEVIAASQRSAAPAFAGELLDGAAFDSTKLAGNVVVINFWGSWCPPCRVESPEFQQVYSQLQDQGVQFLGVDVKDQRQLAQAFTDSAGVQYPSLFDPAGEVAVAFRGFPANAVPSTIVLDAQGRVAAVYTGAVAQQDLTTALNALLDEQPADGGTP